MESASAREGGDVDSITFCIMPTEHDFREVKPILLIALLAALIALAAAYVIRGSVTEPAPPPESQHAVDAFEWPIGDNWAEGDRDV